MKRYEALSKEEILKAYDSTLICADCILNSRCEEEKRTCNYHVPCNERIRKYLNEELVAIPRKALNCCNNCELSKYCNMKSEKIVACVNYKERVPHTNADKIRLMNDEELANFLCDMNGMCAGCIAADFCKYGKIGFVEWLKEVVNIQNDKA